MHTAALQAFRALWQADAAAGVAKWLPTHPGAVAMAGLLAFAGPLKFFAGYLGVLQQRAPAELVQVSAWWLLYGLVLWVCLLVAGHVGSHLAEGTGRVGRAVLWLTLACACAAAPNVVTAGRARILVEQGFVLGLLPMQLYGFALSLTMAALYFAHLGRSRQHESAAARLAAAQAGQREARRRIVQLDLQAVQARIDPVLLFGMLDAVRHAYATDPPRAERLLDELIAFLRASLPALRPGGSSVPREAELARAYAQLLSLAHAAGWHMTLDICDAAMHARFPPGALLPLVDDALRSRGGDCTLQARCADGRCRVVLGLPARPSTAAVARVHALLRRLDGPAAGLSVETNGTGAIVTLWVPHASA
ncbi:histidine kinase [Ramlibacter sp.]|uniref:sensor histidine kinase n=1 Tax=Ramlibacter sp. TaxID=1917967 RepID=UPI002617BD05|nr:histidine kinase [Ramlibacter sp.]MDB5954802.1 sensor histidine kinase [Ramlibacter sp.]